MERRNVNFERQPSSVGNCCSNCCLRSGEACKTAPLQYRRTAYVAESKGLADLESAAVPRFVVVKVAGQHRLKTGNLLMGVSLSIPVAVDG